jgi:hypothetical protein
MLFLRGGLLIILSEPVLISAHRSPQGQSKYVLALEALLDHQYDSADQLRKVGAVRLVVDISAVLLIAIEAADVATDTSVETALLAVLQLDPDKVVDLHED